MPVLRLLIRRGGGGGGEVLFWQIQTGPKPKIRFIRVAANERCVLLTILPGCKSGALEVKKLSATHGTLSQSLTASLLMFLRVKGTNALFRSGLCQLFIFSHIGCKCLIVFLEYM